MPTLAKKEKCTGCFACADSCPKGAISIVNEFNILYPFVDSNKCVDCNLCSKSCPVVTPIKKQHDLHNAKVVAAWSTSDSIRMKSASGGFCTAFSLDFVRKGGKVALCIWNQGKASFILTDQESDILLAANSKYIQSDASGIYLQIQKALSAGSSVLFIGHPCQVGGLYGFLRNRSCENLTTIEFICSAPPSSEAIAIQEKAANGKLLQFRYKNDQYCWQNDYNVVIDTGGEHRVYSKQEGFFYPVFASLLTARYACLNCQYAKANRLSDYVVGDFHGYRTDGWEKGVNLVICNTIEAYNNLKTINGIEFEVSTLKNAIESNTRLYCGWEGVRYHPAIVFRKRFNTLSPTIMQSFLVNHYPYRLLWLCFKALTKFNILIRKNNILKEYCG